MTVETITATLAHMSPEMRLLRASCSAGQAGDDAPLKDIMAATINWDHLLELADYHRIPQLLYVLVRRPQLLKLVPEQFMDNLTSVIHQSTAQNGLLLDEQNEISQAARLHGIPVIHLKGLSLALTVYRDIFLRHAGAIDLLVRKENIHKILRVLREHGYVPTVIETKKRTWSTVSRPEVLALSCELTLRHAVKRTEIDLHWELMKSSVFSIPEEEIWSSRVKHSSPELELTTLSPPFNFIFVARHAAKHGWRYMRWIADLAAILSDKDFDYDQLLLTAQKHQYKRFTLFSLYIAAHFPGVTLPASILEEINQDTPLVKEAAATLRRVLGPTGKQPSDVESILSLARLEDGPWRQGRLLFDSMFEPTLRDWERYPIRRSQFAMFWLLRPLRLMASYGPAWFRRCR